MNIQDLAFQDKLNKLKEGYKKLFPKAGKKLTNAVYRVQVRDLCKEYGKDFKEIWKEN